jgi:aminoglycoside phosphotransferase (APT) family kinase protein
MDAIEIELPWRRSPAELADGLTGWARATLGPDATVVDIAAPQGSGMSSETVLFTISGTDVAGRYVARLAPDPRSHPVFPDYDLTLQQRCMALVAERTEVPVPSCPWLEHDSAWLGAPFLVMTRVDGAAPADVPPYTMTGWVQDLGADRRAVLQTRVIETMAALHTIDAGSADLTFLDRPQHGATPLEQHLGYQRWYFDWARGDVDYPLVERTFAWLHAHRPGADGPTVLNWGDARIGNILFAGTEPVAVLDWEMAAVGPPEIDVAWVVWMHRFFQDIAVRYGSPGLPGFLEPDDVVRTYEAASDRALGAFHWFEVFAALRHAIITVRTSGRMVAFGQAEMPADPDDLVNFRALLEVMLDER